MTAFTLYSLAGQAPRPANLTSAALILIDYQNEYLEGPLTLPAALPAVEQAAALLLVARERGTRIIHIAHRGGSGGPFDRSARRGAIIDQLVPVESEIVIEKPRPNAFSGTDLAEQIGEAGAEIILAGFMTHLCVSSTARAALDLGFKTTIAADACATRDLPSGKGVINAQQLHDAELAALADRFAWLTTVREMTA